MSMLAERKRRQKWSLNPRGKDWSEDQNKFGQKMLEKMGWSKGKGLGSNLHGVTEHVRVSYKNDQNGIGYKARDDQWTEHQDGFNSLLENLAAAGSNGGKEGEVKFQSLEEKSKVSKARVHYAKFTRGKDLSRASAKDLANIFGKKALVNKEEQPKSVEEKEEGFIKNGGSMFDYFKKKLPGFGKNAEGYVVGSNGVLKKDSDSEDEFRGGFGFKSENNRPGFGNEESSFTNSAFDPFVTKVDVKKHVLNPIEEHEEENAEENRNGEDEKRKKSSKRSSNLETIDEADRKNLDREEKPCFEKETGIADENDDSKINNNAFEVSRKKKKKRQDEQVENPYEVVRKDKKKKNKSRIADVTQETPEKMVIKKKNKSVEEPHLNENPCFKEKTRIVDEDDNVTCDDSKISNNAFEVSRKTKKKIPDEQVENPYEVVRKDKKKKNRVADGTQETPEKMVAKKINESTEETHLNENPCFEEENGIVDEDVVAARDDSKISNNAFEVSKKKKKKIPDEQVENPYEVIRKDKKKKEKNRVADVTQETPEKMVVKKINESTEETHLNENPCFEEENGIVDEDIHATRDDSKINNNAFEVSRKKKKKRPLDNPTFNADCPDLQDNNTFEVPRKVKKSKASSVELEESSSGSRKRKRKAPLDNATFNEDDSKDNSAFQVPKKAKKDKEFEEDIEVSDLMLNVTATPTTVPILKSSSTATKRRRSVRFSAVYEERTIPNLDDLAKNELFDINAQVIEKGMVDRRMEAYRRKIEQAQAELENEMNQAKMEEKFIGETETTEGEAEKLPDGYTKLKFKDAKFHNFAGWGKRDATSRAKAAYKKQIIGDVVVQFNNTNLHEIKGYASQPVRRKL